MNQGVDLILHSAEMTVWNDGPTSSLFNTSSKIRSKM